MPEQDIPALCERVREAAEARKAAAASSDSAAWNAATRQLDMLLTDVNTLRILADRDRLVKRVQALQDALGQIIGGREGEYQLFDAEWDRIIAVRKDREWPEPVVEEVAETLEMQADLERLSNAVKAQSAAGLALLEERDGLRKTVAHLTSDEHIRSNTAPFVQDWADAVDRAEKLKARVRQLEAEWPKCRECGGSGEDEFHRWGTHSPGVCPYCQGAGREPMPKEECDASPLP